MTTKLLLLRHGESVVNEHHIFASHLPYSKFVEVGSLHENSMGNVISPYFNAIRSSGTEQFASTAASTRKAFETALTKLEETYAGLE